MNKLIISSLLLFFYAQSVHAELRDPTRPATYEGKEAASSPESTSALTLNLTLISPDHHVVVINGLALHIGDTVGSNHVVTIESNSVQLTGPSGNIMLFLFDKSVKHAVLNGSG